MMKPIVILLVLLFSAGGVVKADAKGQGLFESESLIWVLDEIYAASYDFPAVYLIEEKLEPIRSQIPEEGCFKVQAPVVKNHFEKAFDAYKRFYPDSILPFEQAQRDLELYLGEDEFLRCSEQSENDWEIIKVDHYRKIKGGAWIRFEESQRRN